MRRIKIAETEESFKKLEKISKRFEEEIFLEAKDPHVTLKDRTCSFSLTSESLTEIQLPESIKFKRIKTSENGKASITEIDETYITGMLSDGSKFIIRNFFKQ